MLLTATYPEVKQIEDRNVIKNWRWATGEIYGNKVADSMYHKAKSMGADDIIRFKFHDVYKYNGLFPVKDIKVSGLAIKRK